MANYPEGAEHDPNAPYNQVEIELRDITGWIEPMVNGNIMKRMRFTTNDYSTNSEGECDIEFSEMAEIVREVLHLTKEDKIEIWDYDYDYVKPSTKRAI